MEFRCGVIGIGSHAVKEMLPALDNSKYAKVVALCDDDHNRGTGWSKRLGLKHHSSLETLLDEEQLDFCVVETPHHTHYAISKEIASRGVHVLKEKPLSMNLAEALKLLKVHYDTGVKIDVVAQRRFLPTYRVLKEMLEDIGSPLFVNLEHRLDVLQVDQASSARI